MNVIGRLAVLGSLILCHAASSFGQTTVVQPKVPLAIIVDVAQQPDCPIKLIDVGEHSFGVTTVTFKVQNNSSRGVRGYVLIVEDGKNKKTYTTIHAEKPVEPGSFSLRAVGASREANLSIAVDHVLFADGSTWGSDTYGRSKIINAYLDGRGLAVQRLKEILGDADPADFLASLKTFGSYSIGSPVGAERAGMENIQRKRGYDDVLATLRRMTKRSAEAQELARKIELMETPGS